MKTVGAKGRQIFFSGKAKQNEVGAKELLVCPALRGYSSLELQILGVF